MPTYEVIVDGDEVVAVRVDGVRYESALDVDDETTSAWVSALLITSPAPFVAGHAAKPFPVEKIVAGVFLLVALITLSIAGITGVRAWDVRQREQRVPGVVAELVSRKDSAGNDAFYPRVEFRLPNGDKKSVQLTEGHWPAAYEPGEAVTIVYDRDRPAEARIDTTSGSISRWIAPVITGVLGVVFAGVGLLALSMFRETPTNDESPS